MDQEEIARHLLKDRLALTAFIRSIVGDPSHLRLYRDLCRQAQFLHEHATRHRRTWTTAGGPDDHERRRGTLRRPILPLALTAAAVFTGIAVLGWMIGRAVFHAEPVGPAEMVAAPGAMASPAGDFSRLDRWPSGELAHASAAAFASYPLPSLEGLSLLEDGVAESAFHLPVLDPRVKAVAAFLAHGPADPPVSLLFTENIRLDFEIPSRFPDPRDTGTGSPASL